jgi:hypothetical protein
MEKPRIAAATKGEVHYEGSPCRNCGSTLRYVSTGQCVACVKTKTESRREEIRELIRAARAEA